MRVTITVTCPWHLCEHHDGATDCQAPEINLEMGDHGEPSLVCETFTLDFEAVIKEEESS